MNGAENKNKIYHKHRIGKSQYPTRQISGSGGKGGNIVGHIAALAAINQREGRHIIVAKTDHTRTQWVFCELLADYKAAQKAKKSAAK